MDDGVSSKTVRQARSWLAENARTDDTILVFIAGHGVRKFGEYYFLTPEATMDEPEAGIGREDLDRLVTWDRLSPSVRIRESTSRSGCSVSGVLSPFGRDFLFVILNRSAVNSPACAPPNHSAFDAIRRMRASREASRRSKSLT